MLWVLCVRTSGEPPKSVLPLSFPAGPEAHRARLHPLVAVVAVAPEFCDSREAGRKRLMVMLSVLSATALRAVWA